MSQPEASQTIHELPELRERTGVFADRADAGRKLAPLCRALAPADPLLLAIPAGGVPVAAALAAELGWPLEVLVVSKITLPWNTEVGVGAVAADGTEILNRPLIAQVGLGELELEERRRLTREKVARRSAALRGHRAPLQLGVGGTAVLVDDGLASGFTMQVALASARRQGAAEIVVAAPTGHLRTVRLLAEQGAVVLCANVRSGDRFAVAEAYLRWHDVTDAELAALLRP